MITRKTYRADIDRLRPRIFLASFCIITILFVAAMNINIGLSSADIIDKAIEDIAIDIKLPPLPEQDKNIIAADVAENNYSNRIIAVNDINETKREEIKEQIKFSTLEAENIEDIMEDESTAISPLMNKNEEDAPLRIVEELPEFPGGMSELMRWLTNALKYPQRSKNLKQQGEVKVSFVVEKDGTVSNIKFIKQTHTALDAEVLRVMRIMPKWTPAKHHGKPCRAVIAIPFVFAM